MSTSNLPLSEILRDLLRDIGECTDPQKEEAIVLSLTQEVRRIASEIETELDNQSA